MGEGEGGGWGPDQQYGVVLTTNDTGYTYDEHHTICPILHYNLIFNLEIKLNNMIQSMDRIIYVEVEREGINISTQQTLCISAGDLFLPQIVQELHPVVG